MLLRIYYLTLKQLHIVEMKKIMLLLLIYVKIEVCGKRQSEKKIFIIV